MQINIKNMKDVLIQRKKEKRKTKRISRVLASSAKFVLKNQLGYEWHQLIRNDNNDL